MSLLPRWFASRNLAVQLAILVLVLDPTGSVGGYLLGPSLGVDLFVGGAFGLVTVNVPMLLFMMQWSV